MQFDENKHPRDGDGKFSEKANAGRSETDKYIQWAKNNNIDLPLDSNGALDTIQLQRMYDQSTEKDDDDRAPYGSQEELNALLGEEFKGVKGQAAVDKLLKEKRGHVKGAFHRDDIGDIDLLWGDDYVGLKHILSRREEQGINSNEFVKDLAEVVERGEFEKRNKLGNFEFRYNRKMIIVAPEYHGNKITYVLTAYKTRIKKPPQ